MSGTTSDEYSIGDVCSRTTLSTSAHEIKQMLHQDARGLKWDQSRGRFIPKHGTSLWEIYATHGMSLDEFMASSSSSCSPVLWEPPESFLSDNEIKQILHESQGNEVQYYKKVTAAGLFKQKQAFFKLWGSGNSWGCLLTYGLGRCLYFVVEISGAVF